MYTKTHASITFLHLLCKTVNIGPILLHNIDYFYTYKSPVLRYSVVSFYSNSDMIITFAQVEIEPSTKNELCFVCLHNNIERVLAVLFNSMQKSAL